MADGDGRAALTLAEEVWRAARAGRDLRRRQAAGDRAAPRADLRQGAGRPLQPDLGAAQVGARLRSRTPRSTISAACSMPARTRSIWRAAWCAWRSRISGWPIRRRWCVANAAKDAYDFLGSPEGELAIAQAVIYLATAPKSNAAYTAYGAAMRAAKEAGSLLPPKHILNAPTKLMKAEGYGDGLRLRPRRARRLLRPGLFPRGARPPALLRSARARLRARDQEAAGLLGEAAAREEPNDRSRRLFPPDRLCRAAPRPDRATLAGAASAAPAGDRVRESRSVARRAGPARSGRAREQAACAPAAAAIATSRTCCSCTCSGALGISVHGLGARVLWGAADGRRHGARPYAAVRRARRHAGISPTWDSAARPSPRRCGSMTRARSATAHEPFRLVRAGDRIRAAGRKSARPGDRSISSTCSEQFLPDYEIVNWYQCDVAGFLLHPQPDGGAAG